MGRPTCWLAWIVLLVVNGVSAWAGAADTRPSPFSLENGTVFKGSRGLPGDTHSTTAITVQGIGAPSRISISGPGQYSVNGSSFGTSARTVRRGDRVVVRAQASNTYDASISTTLDIGGVGSSFSLRTILNPSATLRSVSGTAAFVYRDAAPADLRAFVYKPDGWRASDRRAALVCFYGGSWIEGLPTTTPPKNLAHWAASQGMVGITPDYRNNERFATTPLHSVDDGRAAVRWVQDHRKHLGVDPNRIVTCGYSAGGHVALWTAIPKTPPGSDPDTAPLVQPVATVLISSVVDTSPNSGYRPYQFGPHALALSPLHQRAAYMPPTLMFHGSSDQTIPYSQAVSFCDALRSDGNDCELVRINGGVHAWFGRTHSLEQQTYERVGSFLRDHGILPD
ncbi:MAG: alpha/beta hydrolase [Panacagrimonas sp.]